MATAMWVATAAACAAASGSATDVRRAPVCIVNAGCGMAAAGPRGLAEVNATSAEACCAACAAWHAGPARCVQWAWRAVPALGCHLHDSRAHREPVPPPHFCGHIPGWTPPPAPPSPAPPAPAPAARHHPLLHLAPTPGDTVGLLWNPAQRRYEVMWDADSACGWGHASTTDFLSFTQHGCAGPNRQGGGVMSGSIALASPTLPVMTYSYRESIRVATAPNSTMSWFSPSAALSGPAFNASDSCNCSVADIRDPYMWASPDDGGTSNTTLYLLAGGGDAAGVPQALLWKSEDGKGREWRFVSKFWSPSPREIAASTYCRITSCVDTFQLPLPTASAGAQDKESPKHVFLFSDFELHRVRWFVGALGSDSVLVVEAQGVCDWGRLYASQSMADATGTRRLLLGNIGHPHWMAGPDMLPLPEQVRRRCLSPACILKMIVLLRQARDKHRQALNKVPVFSQMVSLPREMTLTPNGLLQFAPARCGKRLFGAINPRGNTVSLPRQTWDKHRKPLRQKRRFIAGSC